MGKWLPIQLFICLLVSSCGKSYVIENGQVYLSGWNEGVGNYRRPVEGADAATFTDLQFGDDCGFAFGRDKEHLYIDGVVLKDLDPSSFQFMGNYVFRDAHAAYFFGFYNDLNDTRIDSIDPNSIVLLEYPWARSGDRLIHGRTWIALDGLVDFQALNESWGRTDRHVIYEGRVVAGADPASFKATSSYQGHDRSHRYEFGKVVD
jgi:hypothetical protein